MGPDGHNSTIWFKEGGTNRLTMTYGAADDVLNIGLLNTSRSYVRTLSYRESDGQLYVDGYVQSEGNIHVGTGGTYLGGDGNVIFSGGMLADYGPGLSSALDKRLGVGQSWQNLTASRSLNTTYQNTSGKPRDVKITTNNSNGTWILQVGASAGSLIDVEVFSYPNATSGTLSVIVPDGHYVRAAVQSGSVSLSKWLELG